MLTAFSLLSQYNPQSQDLADIWDILLVTGWQGMFKVMVAVLKIREDLLLMLSYEEMMGFFSSLAKHDAFTDPNYMCNMVSREEKNGDSTQPETPRQIKPATRVSIKKLIKDIHISEELLKHYELEHMLLEKEIASTWTLLRESPY